MRFLCKTTAASVAAFVIASAFLFGWNAAAQPFQFTPLNSDVSRLSYGSVSLADVNGDGHFDVLFTGNRESALPFKPLSGVALNKASATDNEGRVNFDVISLPQQTWLGKAAWTDFDLDGDLDFLLTGTASEGEPYASKAILYRNGSGWEPEDPGVEGVHASVVRWADFDNDGDSDLLLMGRTSVNEHVVRLYRNESGVSLSPVSTPFPQVALGDAAWADYDLDGDLDIAITGVEAEGAFDTALYRNDGEDGFVRTTQSFPGLAFGALAWGDYDADGDPDLAVSGAVLGTLETFKGTTLLFRNFDGNLIQQSESFKGTFYGGISWADHDLDGDLDLFVMGRTSMRGEHIGLIYENKDRNFTANIGLVGTSTSNAEWADFDGDRDPDVIVSGISVQGIAFTRIYRNDTRLINAAPSPPTGLSTFVNGSDVQLTWNAGQDVETDAAGLTYALRVGTAPGISDIMSAYASLEDGHRLLPGFGNVGSDTRWWLRGLAPGVYYWSVQAIDNSFVGSGFAQENQFTITSGGKITDTEPASDLPGAVALTGIFPNPLRDHATVTFELPEPVHVRLAVYDLLGQEIGVIADRDLTAGWHRLPWDASSSGGAALSSGTYFVRMTAGNARENKPVVVLR